MGKNNESKSYKVDFYWVAMPEDTDFESILHKVNDIPKSGRKRNVESNDDWLRLIKGDLTEEGFFGDLMRIQMRPPGFRATLKGDVQPINMGDDEGFADGSAFYYDFEARVLVLQRNGQGATKKHFTSYFRQLGDLNEDIELIPILNRGTMDRVRTMQALRKIQIKSILTEAMPTLDKLEGETLRQIRSAASYGAKALDLAWDCGKKKTDQLNKESVIKEIESWLEAKNQCSPDESVQKILVKGLDEGNTTCEFDVLDDRLFAAMEVDLVADPLVFYETRRRFIQQSWDLNKRELRKQRKSLSAA